MRKGNHMNHIKIEFDRLDWYALLPRLGVEPELIANPKKMGPCPIEGDGKTRFRFDNKGGRGTWICNHCGAGDGVRLVALVNATDDAGAVRLIREQIQGVVQSHGTALRTKAAPSEKRTPQAIEKARRLLEKTLGESKPIEGTPALKYLQNRIPGLDLRWLNTESFRFHPSLYHFDEENSRKSFLPALLAKVKNAATAGDAVSLHRYYITKDGFKAKVSPSQVKKMMSATVEKIHGESILINTAPACEVVIVSEGLENGLAWVMATQNRIPVYSAMNCGNLEHFNWPAGTKAILIAADHDQVNPKTGLRPGTHHAMLLKKRAVDAGLMAVVKVPPTQGIDWDDMWNSGEFPSVDWLFRPATDAVPA